MQMRRNVDDLADVLGISRASLYGYRKGQRKVSAKAWLKLEEAEREAGIGQETDTAPDDHDSTDAHGMAALSVRLGRLESLLEEVLAELRAKDSPSMSSKVRGEKF